MSLSAFGQATSAQNANEGDRQRLSAETKKLQAEKAKLDAEAAYFRKSPWLNLIQNSIGFGALLVPIIIGLRQLREQRVAQADRAKVDASLKAAEIAMSAPTTGQVRSRAQMLAVLLKDFVPDFGKQLPSLDFTKIGFASYRSRFANLLDAISSHPEHALLLAETYDLLFPDDDKNSGGRVAALLRYLRQQPV